MKFILPKGYLLIPFFIGMGACSNYLDVNVSPNNPTSVTPAVLLAGAEGGSAFANANELNRFASVLVNQLAGAANSPATYDIFQTNSADFGNQWTGELYNGPLINYQKLIELGDATNSKAYSGIAKIMKAYTFSIATDVWGDVPYSQALLGEANTTPRLDAQADIYKGNATAGIQSLFDLVREGIKDLDAASTLKPAGDDIIYAGNLTKWKQAGNTLLLKFARRSVGRNPLWQPRVINEVTDGRKLHHIQRW